MKMNLYLEVRRVLLLLFSISSFFACSDAGPSQKSSEQKEREPQKGNGEKNEAVALFFGNSLTAGKGVSQDEAFPALIRKRIDSLGWAIEVVNAGVSGETSAGGESRIDWVLEQQRVDLFVLELGANDGLRGVPPSETKENLQAIIDKVEEAYPEARIVLAGMKVPPNMGQEYGQEFEKVFPSLAERNGIELIPFLLEDVAGRDSLNRSDGIHPNPKGHKIVARTVWKAIEDELRSISKKEGAQSKGGDHLQLDSNRGRER